MSLIVGASFTAVTVRTNVVAHFAHNGSVTVTVTLLVPYAFATGCMLIVQLVVAAHPKVILPTGSTLAFELVAVTFAAQDTV